jgi:hypothetical protein
MGENDRTIMSGRFWGTVVVALRQPRSEAEHLLLGHATFDY